MSETEKKAVAAVAAIVNLQLAAFAGLEPGTTRAQVAAAAGPLYAEGFGGGEIPLWMTVYELDAGMRLTAWYRLSESEGEANVGPGHTVEWIERPVTPDQVEELVQCAGSHRPSGVNHLLAWPARGLCLRYSRRSRLPTLLFAFEPMTPAEFDRSPMARQP